jgi:hypothetical protein
VRNPNSTTAIIALTLFGSFAVGMNLSSALHEFGHAVGIWLAGAQVTGLYLTPFGASMVHYSFDRLTEKWPYFLYAWGGVIGGTAFSLAFLGSVCFARRGNIWWLIAMMTATTGLAINGLLLVLGSINPFGDASDLVYGLGNSRPFLFVVGFFLLIGFFYVFPRLVRGLGLKKGDGPLRWIVAVVSGFLLYFVFMAAHSFFVSTQVPPSPFTLLGYLLCLATLAMVAAAIAFHRADRDDGQSATNAVDEPSWSRAGTLVVLGCLIVVAELVVF